jgi:hypothetical protein
MQYHRKDVGQETLMYFAGGNLTVKTTTLLDKNT